jgi:hypothetical protein
MHRETTLEIHEIMASLIEPWQTNACLRMLCGGATTRHQFALSDWRRAIDETLCQPDSWRLSRELPKSRTDYQHYPYYRRQPTFTNANKSNQCFEFSFFFFHKKKMKQQRNKRDKNILPLQYFEEHLH